MSAVVIALVAVNLILLAERYVSWYLLWSRYLDRERRADQILDRWLGSKGIRPLAEPKLEQSRPSTPVLSQDELDVIEDRIKERLEVATLRNESISQQQAEAEVWATLGYRQPPILNGK